MGKIDVVLSHPWRDDKDRLKNPGDKVSVEADVAENIVRGGAGVFATKSAAEEAGVPDAPTVRSK